ncbi:MAG: hypothetical protein GY794_18435 [bacterium]|nr:hypothetical protein [bacterium]
MTEKQTKGFVEPIRSWEDLKSMVNYCWEVMFDSGRFICVRHELRFDQVHVRQFASLGSV